MIALLLGAASAVILSLFGPRLWFAFRRASRRHTNANEPPKNIGGAFVVTATVLGYLLGHASAHEPISISGLLLLDTMAAFGAFGLIGKGASSRAEKLSTLSLLGRVGGVALLSLAFALAGTFSADKQGRPLATWSFSALSNMGAPDQAFLGLGGLLLGVVAVALFFGASITGFLLSESRDGYLSGALLIAALAYVGIAFWQFNEQCGRAIPGSASNAAHCYAVANPLDLASFAACLAGALIGFLWWNTHPAQLEMGQTGVMAVGAALAALAVLTHTELLLVIVAAPSLLNGLRRIKPQPARTQRSPSLIVAEERRTVRFWILSSATAAVGIGVFYLEWFSSR